MSSHPESRYRLDLEIAGISLSLRSFQKWKEEPAFLPFVKHSDTPDYTALFRETEALPEIPGGVIHEDECYRVHPDGRGGYLRSFFDAPRDFTPYAVAEYDHARGSIRIDCLPKGRHCVSEVHNSFFHLGFESILIHSQRLCLHAACVRTDLGGLLFSGPSGIGKSTQADLWQKHRGARLINGDRPILSRGEAGWLAWGSPYAGSSRCHVNESCPVTAIVLLEQAENCTLERLSLSAAFRALWAGLTICTWDRWYVEEASSLLMQLVGAVPVYRFRCTPGLDAVECLEQELKRRTANE